MNKPSAQEDFRDDWRGDYQSQKLLELATPDIYLQNAFRVIGLPVDASPREIARQRTRLQQMMKVGIRPAGTPTGMMPLNPPPDEDQITRAAHRLNESEHRLLDELFWFWPHAGASSQDGALKLLTSNRLNDAQALWLQEEQASSQGKVSTHNLAVFYHVIALDLERAAIAKTLSKERHETRRGVWAASFERWRILMDDEGFWSRLTARISELDDPRLTTGTARRIRASLPKALLLINARLAVRAAERGDEPEVKFHLGLMGSDDFDPSTRDEALQEALSPAREKFKIICTSQSEKLAASPGQGDQLAQQVLTDTQLVMRAVDWVLPAGNAVRDSVHDEIAAIALNCTIAFGNESHGWEQCGSLLRTIYDIARSESLRNRIKENLDVADGYTRKDREYAELRQAVAGNKVYEVAVSGERISVPQVCACCLGPAEIEQPVSYSWEEDAGHNTRIKHTRTFAFPLCKECRRHQQELARQRVVLVLVSIGLSVIASFVIGINIGRIQYVPFVLMGGVLSAIAFGVLAGLVRVQVLKDDHAVRGPAVSMASVMGSAAVFSFHNPLYADAFAKGNQSSLVPKVVSKYSRGPSLLRGKAAAQVIGAAIVIAVIGHSIVFGLMNEKWGSPGASSPRSSDYSSPSDDSSGGSHTPPYYSPPTVVPSSPRTVVPSSQRAVFHIRPPTPSPDDGLSLLGSQIDSAKAQVKVMESELERLDAQLESLSSRLEGYKRSIDIYESQVAAGLTIDRDAYRRAISDHNALVEQHNRLLADLRAKHAAYKAQIDRVNEMVDRYNSRASRVRSRL